VNFDDHVFAHQNSDGSFDLDAAEEDFRYELETTPSELLKYAARAARSERKAWTDRETAHLRKQLVQPALSPALELDAMVPLGDGTVVRLGDMNRDRISMRRDMRRRAHEDETRAYAAEVAFWERAEALLQGSETIDSALARGQQVAA
jgi:hypothetical protein